MKKILGGVIPPVVTPFRDEELDLVAYRANMARWNQTGLSGYLVLGSNGEAVGLSLEEKEALLAATAEAAAPEKLIMAGTGAESTRETVRLTQLAAKHGADCALVLTPAYFKSQMTPARLQAHFRQVADEASIPILLYNVPQMSGLNLGAESVAALADHPNIIGVKDSSGNIAQLTEILRLVPADFIVLVGSAEVFYPALCVGAKGGILAVSNALPEVCLDLFESHAAGNHGRALARQMDIIRLAALVTRIHGIGGLKAAMALAGYQAGQVRAPLAMPGPDVVAELAAEMDKIAARTT